MRDFFKWLGLCRRTAIRHFQLIVDLPLYVITFGVPFLAWLYPNYWNSTAGQSQMNAFSWEFPSACAAFILIGRLLLSPYWVHREAIAKAAEDKKLLAEENNTLVEHLRSQNLEIQAKLNEYVLTPITVGLSDTDGTSLIKVLVTNRGNIEQRILGMYLSLAPWDQQLVEHELLIRERKRFSGFPFVMPTRSSFELTLAESTDDFLDFGTVSFHVVLKLEDGRKVESEVIDISKRQQKEFPLPLTISESIERSRRIGSFFQAYAIIYKSLGQTEHVDLSMLVQAGIGSLTSNDEIKQACDRLVTGNMHHALDPVYFATEVDIYHFFQTMAEKNMDLSGTGGALELFYWQKYQSGNNEELLRKLTLPKSSEQEQIQQIAEWSNGQPGDTLRTHEQRDTTAGQEKGGEESKKTPQEISTKEKETRG